jgi:hypothetical protein
LLDRQDPRGRPNKEARLDALKKSWDGVNFRCYYSKQRLATDDPASPWYLVFDHRTPRNESDLVCAAAVINDMKSDLSEDEFKAAVVALAAVFTDRRLDASLPLPVGLSAQNAPPAGRQGLNHAQIFVARSIGTAGERQPEPRLRRGGRTAPRPCL